MNVTSRLLADSARFRWLCGEDRCGNPSKTGLGISGQDLLAVRLCAAHDTAHRPRNH